MQGALPRRDDGKVEVFHAVTGERVVRWPVDARDMLRSGEYVLTVVAPVTAEAAPVAAGDIATLGLTVESSGAKAVPPLELDAMSRAELVAHAESLGLEVEAKATKAQLVALIQAATVTDDPPAA